MRGTLLSVRDSRWLRAGAIVLAAAVLAGCNLTRALDERSRIDYKSAGKVPSLDIPPDLASPRGDGRFDVPQRTADDRTASGFERSRAAARASGEATVLPGASDVRMERSGSERWLVTSMSPDRVWPLLREFWHESGFILESESPQTGIMETDWAENRAKIPQDFIRRSIGRVFDSLYSTGERDKFRTRVDRGRDGTEIHITHRGMVEVYSTREQDQTRWQPRPSDPELEIEFLRKLMVKLGGSQESAAQAGAGGESGASAAGRGSARVVTVEGKRELQIDESFDRAWRQLNLAMDRGGFMVDDRDRSQGLFFVRYIDPEAQARQASARPGLLSRVFGSRKAEDISKQFRVKAEPQGDATRVTVLDAQGNVPTGIDAGTATRILNLLQQQLQ